MSEGRLLVFCVREWGERVALEVPLDCTVGELKQAPAKQKVGTTISAKFRLAGTMPAEGLCSVFVAGA